MRITLRPYQKECIETIHEHFKTHNKQLIQLPTGAGKTFIFLHYIKLYSVKTLIVVPSVELEEQVIHWGRIILDDRNIFARRACKRGDVIVITAASLNHDSSMKMLASFDFDTVIIDEAHHAQAKTYKKFLSRQQNKYKLLGCTATPERLDGKSLLEIFDNLTFSRNIVDLVRNKDLCEIQSQRIKTGIKLSSNLIRNGDFAPVNLKNLNNETRNGIIYRIFFDECIDKKTLIFCVSIEHAKTLAMHLKEKGIKSEAIYGELSKTERTEILERFKSGKTQVLTNCQLLTEGFDEPSIEALIIARPTLSKSFYCQMIGRGLRNHPGKKCCYLYELTDNAHRICTFNVLAGISQENDIDYQPGTRLLELVKHYETIDPAELEIKKESLDIFDSESLIPENESGSIDRYSIACKELSVTQLQKKQLNAHPYINQMSFLEAAFTIWKEKLKRKYGYN